MIIQKNALVWELLKYQPFSQETNPMFLKYVAHVVYHSHLRNEDHNFVIDPSQGQIPATLKVEHAFPIRRDPGGKEELEAHRTRHPRRRCLVLIARELVASLHGERLLLLTFHHRLQLEGPAFAERPEE